MLEQALVREARVFSGVSAALLLAATDGEDELRAAASDPQVTDRRRLLLEELPDIREAIEADQPVTVRRPAAAALAGAVGLAPNSSRALLLPARPPAGPCRYLLILADDLGTDFSAVEIEAAAAFASAASASLGQVHLAERNNGHAARQSALARAAKALNESLDLERVLPRICDEAAAILSADAVAVYRGTAASGLVLEASSNSPELIGSRIEPGAGIVAQAMALGRPLLSNREQRIERRAVGRTSFADVRSALAAPMRWDGELRGALWVGYRRQRHVDEEDLALLERFAELAAIACRNASVHASLAEAARTDALTGCLNHAALHETLRREMQRTRRTGRRLSIVMVDLDHFKQVNEQHGHLMGDEVLRRVGRALREAVRPYDFVARYGGDEFAIVAVDAREERACEIAERAIERLGVALDEVLGAGAESHATAGVAEWNGSISANDLIRQADRALLYGKQEGVRGAPIGARGVPIEFMLGKPAEDERGKPAGPGPAPWPSAVRRETEPLRERTRQLSLATALGSRISGMTRSEAVVEAALEELENHFGYWLCSVVRCGPDGSLEWLGSRGRGSAGRLGMLRQSQVVEQCLAERRSVIVGDLSRPRGQVSPLEAARSELAVPIWVDTAIWGALDIQEPSRQAFAEAEARLLETVSDQLGSALRSAALYEQLEDAYVGTSEALAAALETKDLRGLGRERSIVEQAQAVGRHLGMGDDELRDLRYAAVLHDIGKSAVPEAILAKPGPLTDAERRSIERHTIVSEQILTPVNFLSGVLPLVRHCHERWDGRGYPDGLAGEGIPSGARVITVCDAHQAMTSDRPYRRALAVPAARAELRRTAGTQFDAKVVEAFLEIVGERQAPAA